jgi:hypothetical protein
VTSEPDQLAIPLRVNCAGWMRWAPVAIMSPCA